MASLGFGVSRARMVASRSVSEFLECSKNLSGADPHLLPCSKALPALPVPALVPVTLLVFALVREPTGSPFSLSFISILFSNFQLSMFPSMCVNPSLPSRYQGCFAFLQGKSGRGSM